MIGEEHGTNAYIQMHKNDLEHGNLTFLGAVTPLTFCPDVPASQAEREAQEEKTLVGRDVLDSLPSGSQTNMVCWKIRR